VARIEREILHTDRGAILDVVAFGNEAICIEEGSVAFVRSGYFAHSVLGTSAIVDANYAVFGCGPNCLLTQACEHICACTIVRCADAASPEAACTFVSSRAFLLQSQIVRGARGRESDLHRALVQLLRETREGCAATLLQSPLVTEIRRRLNESPSRHVALGAIAREFYASPFTISRLFHRETGMPLRVYSSRLRLRRALTLLMNSRKNLTGIAIDLGFYDESHFSKAFRAEFGLSPHSVRKYSTKSDFC
jgi:AraC-like DNA-binding protein